METNKPKRKNIIVGGIIAALAVVGIANASHPAQQPAPPTPAPAVTTQQTEEPKVLPAQTQAQTQPQTTTPAPQPAVAPTPTPTKPTSCPNGYYMNVDGDCIQSPTASPSAPAGATAECRDGTYSFSQNHSGTCSHHGGVARWL
jgi:outer membrane biosynthesis protein TonB